MENKEVKKIKMSVVRKVTKNLSPTDFEKPVDENLLDRLKKNVAELKNFSTLWLVQLAVVVAVCLLMQLEKSVRFELFFAIIILPVVMNHFKQQKVDESFHRLGITETELKQAIDACKERMQS
jgi:membrane protein required for beta-lactamase induction